MLKMLRKYKNFVLYIFFGVCTTGINVISYWFSARILGLEVLPSTIIAWTVAVLFAFVTNRKWVFESSATSKTDIIKELIRFFLCRIATGIIDVLCMYIFVDVMQLNDMLIKILANILVIILNYIASKIVVFKS